MNIGIYKITNPKGKIYIGQSVNIERRFKSYKKLTCEKQPKLYNSFQKYGVEKHRFNIIEECSIEQLDKRETHWKQYYLDQFEGDWGMVLFCGLYDTGGGPLSEETKQKMSISALGKPKNHGYKISRIKMKKVFQYDLNCNFIREFNSVKEAAEYLGIGCGTIISNCCNKSKKNKTAYGYIWKWKDDKSDFSWNVERSSKNIKIFQYDLLGNFIKDYNSIYEAATCLGLDKGTISLCINGKRKTCGGYYFTDMFYKDLPFEIYLVFQSDLKGNIINYFTSPSEAEFYLRGKNSDNIASCCRGKSQTAYGYKWFIKKIN